MCFNSPGNKLYVSGASRFIYCFDTTTGKLDAHFNYVPGFAAVTSMALLSDTVLFVVFSDGQTALVDCLTKPGNVLRRPAAKTPVKSVFRHNGGVYTWTDSGIQSRTILGDSKPDSNRTANSTTAPRFLDSSSGKLVTNQAGEILITGIYGSQNRLYIGQDRSWVFLQGTSRYAASSPDLVFTEGRSLTDEEAEAGKIMGGISL